MNWPLIAKYGVVAVVALLVLGGIARVLRDNDEPSASEVAGKISADWCRATDYQVENRLDGSASTIFDCMTGAKERCVTVEQGIAHDSTETVRLLFADTLGGDKPSCI